ncbi:nucleotidyltransferase [Eubacteriales bacterium OttesenSCG-928-N13]|nr:nucleotidyltransferase [Eubacteriales bacterium OttesenSCG-928-N13]
MSKPALIIMAAGLGSRYGGLKQIDPVDDQGCAIIDYSIYDARRAGFEQIILVIKPELEQDFRDTILKRVDGAAQIQFAYQTMDKIPDGIAIPEGRTKPWGTAHAVLCAKELVNGAFAVINADDFYGRNAYQQIFDFLNASKDDRAHAMVGYRLSNTLTEFGYVSRGVCQVDAESRLTRIIERVRIERHEGAIAYTEDGGQSYTNLAPDTLVSMNLWGFGASMMNEIEQHFKPFLLENLPENPLKTEYFLPYVPDLLIREGVATVTVLPTEDRWYGVTYHEDMPYVRASIAGLREQGIYPARLWG